MQKPVIQAMVAVMSAVTDLVRDAKTGETASAKMAKTITKLVDALALLNHAMQDINQHRRDDLKGEMNQAYKGLSKGEGHQVTTTTGEVGCVSRGPGQRGTPAVETSRTD